VADLTGRVTLAGRRAPSRVVFGPHVTNLGRGRDISDRHVAYYARRAAGGAGIVVCETASVHPSDWPYERAPLAADCGPGWAAVADACRPHGTLVLAGLGHTGGQGSSAYSQHALWAPSGVADAVNREMPMVMEQPQIDELADGFAAAARTAAAAGLDGVDVDAGPSSLLRQFASGLTNHRDDDYGTDRLLLLRRVLGAVRRVLGDDRVLALRLSCDELAPWDGITPDHAAATVAELAPLVDLLTVVRGGPFSASAERPGAYTPPMANLELCRQMREAAGGRTLVALQGSVVDPVAAQGALDDGVADLVEMTRAQIADARLVGLVRRGEADRVRPCLLCNQACQVRDSRNPLVSCVVDPRSGHESTEPLDVDVDARWADQAGRADQTGQADQAGRAGDAGPGHGPDVLVVGAGPAGLECARVLALGGARVEVRDRCARAGGTLRRAAVGPGRERLATLVDWLEHECLTLGVTLSLGNDVTGDDLAAADAAGRVVVLATGSRPAPPAWRSGPGTVVVDALEVLGAHPDDLVPGAVAVHDPVGGPVGVGIAEWLAGAGRSVSVVTPDPVAGTLLSLAGDLADANTRLQRAGVTRELRARLVAVGDGGADVVDVWTGEARRVACDVLVDCGHRLPDDGLAADRPGTLRAGDCVAPRTALEAVLEGRRAAAAVAPVPVPFPAPGRGPDRGRTIAVGAR